MNNVAACCYLKLLSYVNGNYVCSNVINIRRLTAMSASNMTIFWHLDMFDDTAGWNLDLQLCVIKCVQCKEYQYMKYSND